MESREEKMHMRMLVAKCIIIVVPLVVFGSSFFALKRIFPVMGYLDAVEYSLAIVAPVVSLGIAWMFVDRWFEKK